MAVEIKVTPAGESVTHATIIKWLKPDGSAVKVGEPICELETDKANSAIHLHWFDELDRSWIFRGSDNPTFLALQNLRATILRVRNE